MLVTIIGNRPQIIKAAMVSRALLKNNVEEKIIYTWQHFTDQLSVGLMQELSINYSVSSQVQKKLKTNPVSIQDYLFNIELQAKKLHPKIHAVLVYGDTNSTLAGALFAKKYLYKLIHVEAGERSYNNQMPEEQNRIATDYLADLLLCVGKKSVAQIQRPLYSGKNQVVGDVMLDALLHFSKTGISVKEKKIDFLIKTKQPYIYFTLHRQSNTMHQNRLTEIIQMLGALPYTVLWPVHPRIFRSLQGLVLPANIIKVDPISYLESVIVLKNAQFVITDSGGLQKEAYWLQKKCITLREDTEWPETLSGNWNILYSGGSGKQLASLLNKKTNHKQWSRKTFGNGNAAGKVAKAIIGFLK